LIKANELGNWIAETPIPNQSLETRNKHFSGEDGELLLEFMRRVIRWLPEERPTAEDLYEDAFIYQDPIGSSSRNERDFTGSAE
jgi:hypothetical protein